MATIEKMLASDWTSDWLKSALKSALSRDAVDAVNDAEALLAVLTERLNDI